LCIQIRFMLFSTKGIVLHRFKYSDSKIIAKIYTEEFGLQAYLIFASDSKKGRLTKSLLQPMFLLDMEVYHNEKRELQKIKEISNQFPFLSIPFDIHKSTIGLFLAEFLIKVIEENEPDKKFFKFLSESIKFFDSIKENFQNFHLIFLLKMSKFLGIKPENNFAPEKSIFDLEAGRFITGIPNHKHYVGQELSMLINTLLKTSFENMQTVNMNNTERRRLLNIIIDYYTLHLGKPGQMKTLKVLRQIF